ncbi:regulator of MON1-CCZ1 complex isoform X2 [Brachypodium distachyon]|uniref:regulator of MON1-CCZ1 complex isoform X2 n=1 Tax=Brachypodium distachyon TaxID=15368 RepID=UPI00071E20EF|nr:regulator of MON1-CCZ1 complex isoform X2 [Brachypodium distachyon]|eukprot:XP_003573894.2 regulator of MON1-CCZ1 complex isoform X2 [Brachypodium distachyon]
MQGGLGSAGALSHAYVQHPPLRCDIPDIRGLFYDDANKFLIAPTADRILYWKIALCTPSGPPNSDPVNEGPVLSVRFSLDQKAIGIQRSNREVEFRNRETGEACSNKCRADSETMLGFFWTDCPTCDVIIIKTSGLDLLVYERQSNALRLVESKKFNMSWYLYTHESRLLLLASGMQSTLFTGYQFSAGGIVKLPKFEMIMSTCEANNKPVLAATDVHIVTVYAFCLHVFSCTNFTCSVIFLKFGRYGRIYCLQLDRVNMGLNLYRFYRDAVVQQGTLPIYSSRIAVSAVDNIIMVHQIDAKVVILYDVFMDSFTPISAPLPLLVRGLPSNNRQPGQLADHQSAYGGTIYGEGWNFLIPDLICDSENGLLWKLHLDLEAVAASTSDAPSVLELLQRRKSDLSMVKTLSLAIVRTIILERRPITMVAKAMAVILDSYSCLMKMGGSVSGVRRASEQQQSSGQPFEDSSVILLEPPSRTMIRPVVNTESASGVETRPPQSNSGVEHGIASLAAHVDRTSLNTSSNSDDIINTSRGSQTSDATSERPQALGEDRRPLASGTSIQHGPHGAGVAISPIEMFQSVFVLVEDEMMGDPAYLIAVIMEFLRSMSKAGLKAPPKLYVMMTALLAHSNRYAEIALFVSNKILEPSRELAMQLIELGRHHLLTRKLGVDMLRERCLHDDYVAALLHEGYYLEALRYARKYKVITVQPALFLEKAVAMDSVQNLAAVLSFFSEFTPSFKTTLDYSRYRHILSEMI